MSDSKSSGNLTKGDVISFVAILLMGVLVFFGMNFMTLGDRIPSMVVAILTVLLMTVFVFLAAYAKSQDRDRSKWKAVAYSMLALYVLALVPCYVFSAKFFDVQLGKEDVIRQVNTDTDNLDRLFKDYNRKCESRVSAYQIELKSMMTTAEGRARVAKLLDTDAASVTAQSVDMAVESFSKSLKGAEFRSLEAEKNNLKKNCEADFNSWNIMMIPQYAQELGTANKRYASELKRIYDKSQNSFEHNVPEFDVTAYESGSAVLDKFTKAGTFSVVGLLAVLFLGILGLVKYLLTPASRVVEFKKGDATVIEQDGGFWDL